MEAEWPIKWFLQHELGSKLTLTNSQNVSDFVKL